MVDDLNKDNTDPVVIGDTSVNILLYADDIVLLSQSKVGLQNSLNILHDFCYTWKLKVNTDKSKLVAVGQPAWQESSKVKSQSRDFRFIFDEKWRSSLRLKYVGLQ